MKKELKLYNLIFPVWLIWMFPPFVFVVAGLNLIIDAVVILITAKSLKTGGFLRKYKVNIQRYGGMDL